MGKAITLLRPQDIVAIESSWPVLVGDDDQVVLPAPAAVGGHLPQRRGVDPDVGHPDPEPEPPVPPEASPVWTPAQVWADVARLVAAGLPAPGSMAVSCGQVILHMETQDEVDVWARVWLGVPAQPRGAVHETGSGRRWRAYAARVEADVVAAPQACPYPGWWLAKVWCVLDMPSGEIAAAVEGGDR
jgi:hypothetical protein